MGLTQKTKPKYLVIQLSGHGFSLFAKEHDADALAKLCLQSMLSFDRQEDVCPGVDSLSFFYVTERARAERVLGKYLSEKQRSSTTQQSTDTVAC